MPWPSFSATYAAAMAKTAQSTSPSPTERRGAGTGVDDEQDQRRLVQGRLGLALDLGDEQKPGGSAVELVAGGVVLHVKE